MDQEVFSNLVEKRLDFCKSTLFSKNEEYSRDDDKLHNFKQAAALDSCTPEQALWGMWMKHIVSVKDIIEDTGKRIFPSQQILDDKITDMINYCLLLEALIVETKLTQFYVYVYLDPRKPGKYVYGEYKFDHEPFYVGKGKENRYEMHLRYCFVKNITNSFFNRKIKKILSEEKEVKIVFAKKGLKEEQAFSLENKLITLIGRSDLQLGPLTNLTDGGDGQRGISDITKEKISKKLTGRKGHPQTEETRKKISEGRKGIVFSDSHKAKLKNNCKGRKCSPEEIEKRNASRWANGTKRKPASEETRKKLSEAALKRGISDETRKKMNITYKNNRKLKLEKENNIGN